MGYFSSLNVIVLLLFTPSFKHGSVTQNSRVIKRQYKSHYLQGPKFLCSSPRSAVLANFKLHCSIIE
jgi:hypothetical protein